MCRGCSSSACRDGLNLSCSGTPRKVSTMLTESTLVEVQGDEQHLAALREYLALSARGSLAFTLTGLVHPEDTEEDDETLVATITENEECSGFRLRLVTRESRLDHVAALTE